jgi:class 3 adenylate cyclase/tetratricopeptide (TPR) repeat protein
MKCPRCAFQNRPGARFCAECAAPLAAACGHCGAELAGTARFCSQCGHPTSTPRHPDRILTSTAALEAERKQVTVLFADLKGSMELLADRDPEEARRLVDPVLAHMMDAVHRYEGTVNQVMGDGIMALFGAPVAHEDHALRACYAALAMQDAVKRHADEVFRLRGVRVEIRIGVNSGEVVVRAIGSDLHMDYTAVGQTAHLAGRMEQAATPGTILITAETLALVAGFVEVRLRGPVVVKGLTAPMEVFELTGATPVRSRLHAAAARGLTRFVGRDAEMELLRQALARAGEGHGQVFALVGEAGVGKSRLVWEFTQALRGDWRVLEAAGVSYGRTASYLPVIDLLRRSFGLDARDEPAKVRDRVASALAALDPALAPALPALLALLDVPVEDDGWSRLEPAERRRQTLDALRRLVLRESQAQPVLLVVEDLHWIDSETRAWLDLVVESAPTARLLLLVDYRPEYAHGWSSKSYYHQLQLDTLPRAGAQELVRALLGTGPGLDHLGRVLIERTQGNPLFLEEMVRALVETGTLTGQRGAYRLAGPIERLQLPATAQAILAARIDRLAPQDKRLLQASAVVGRDVPFAVLEAIAGEPQARLREGLARLQAAEFLYEARLFPELEFTFKHALTHEVAYAGLLQEQRRALHARILAALERFQADRPGEHVERLAHHAIRGDVRDKAAHYSRQAGLKAAARSALADARTWLEQALGILGARPDGAATREQAFDIRLELRPVLSLLGEPRAASACLREALVLAERLDDDHRRGRVSALMTNAHSLLGELDEAVESGTRALAIARRLDDATLGILATTYLEQARYWRGDYEEVVDLATTNLAAVSGSPPTETFGAAAPVAVFDRFWLVRSLAELGRFAEAAERQAEAMRFAELTRHAFTLSLADFAGGSLHLVRGDWAQARSVLEHGISLIRTGNVVLQVPLFFAGSAWALAQVGDAGEAVGRVREAEGLLQRQASRGVVHNLGWAYHALGRACLVLGRLDEARRLGDRALSSVACQLGCAAHVRHLLGDIAAHPDRSDPATGEAHYRAALALAEGRGMRPLVAHCHAGLARLHARTGQRGEADAHLTAAAGLYRAMGMTYWVEQTEREADRLRAA